MIQWLPHVNASLNSCAAILLVAGLFAIKAKRESAHKLCMYAAFGMSVLFLASYLTYHFQVTSKPFPRESYPAVAWVYYGILLTHVLLAIAVPFLAVTTIYLGIKDRRTSHKKWAKITFPIWLYVSVTGVVVYFMLYWIYLPPAA
jgi:putative membrane protein